MRRRPLGAACLVVVAFLFVMVHMKPAPYVDYGGYQGDVVTVTGKVYKKEAAGQEEKELVLYLGLVHEKTDVTHELNTGPLGEKVLCYLKPGEAEPEMGSVVRLSGKLSQFERASNPGQFDAYSFYQISGISYRLSQAKILAKTTKYNRVTEMAYKVRGFLCGVLEENLPAKEAAVMQTMLLGEKSGLDKELKSLYQRNGIAHILAISGLHISMLGMGLYGLLRKCGISMRVSAGVSMTFMIFYCVMTGFSVSAVRAVLMFCLRMGAVFARRTYDMLTALGVAAVLILLEQPLYLYHSGFVFSFGCVLGIGLVLPALTEERGTDDFRYPLLRPVVRGIVSGLGVAVVTLPIYLWFYYQFPVYSVILNLFVIPLMSFLMGAGLLILLFGLLCPFLTAPFAVLVKIILMAYEGACGLCDRLPGRLMTPGRPLVWQMVIYLILITFVIIRGKKLCIKRENKFRMASRWGIAALAVAVLLVHPRVQLELTFLDVGQGDCIYIENAGGNCYLVDGGSSSVKNPGTNRIIPFLQYQGVSRLEAVFVTHPDKDHCNGIKELMEEGALEGIRIQNLILPDIAQGVKSEAYQELEQMAEKAGIKVSYISRGQKISDGRLNLSCLHPSLAYENGEANEYSVVLKLTYGNFTSVLTGDVEGEGEKDMMRFLQNQGDLGGITVLKAAHHGSRGSTPWEFLDSCPPAYGVISCGENNSYGHPHSELLKRLEEHNTKILITYETGAVTFVTNGRKMQIESFS